jgi:hypothetical protein
MLGLLGLDSIAASTTTPHLIAVDITELVGCFVPIGGSDLVGDTGLEPVTSSV